MEHIWSLFKQTVENLILLFVILFKFQVSTTLADRSFECSVTLDDELLAVTVQ